MTRGNWGRRAILAALAVSIALFSQAGSSRGPSPSAQAAAAQTGDKELAQAQSKTVSRARIDSVSPKRIRLTPGGPSVVLSLKGDHLDHLKGVRVLLNNTRTYEFKTIFDTNRGRTARTVSVAAISSAVRRSYYLRSVKEDDSGFLVVEASTGTAPQGDQSGCLVVEVGGSTGEGAIERTPLPSSTASLLERLAQTKKDKSEAIGKCRELRKLNQGATFATEIETAMTENLNNIGTIERILKQGSVDKGSLNAALDRLHASVEIMESLMNRRQEATTAFANFDQKVNQLYNLLSTVMKNEKEMATSISRNIL